MTMNGVMTLILRYFTEFGSYVRYLVPAGEFLVCTCDEQSPPHHAMQ